MQELHNSRDAFLRAIEGLSEEQWRFHPAAGRWSIADVAEHVAVIEDICLDAVTQRLRPSAARHELADAAALPPEKIIPVMADRSEKRQAPELAVPTGRWPSAEELIRHFRESRELLIRHVETAGRGLYAGHYRHYHLGLLNGYQWALLASGHLLRHLAQIEEIKRRPGFPEESRPAEVGY